MYDSVDWELGPHGKHQHASCRLDISSSDKLKRSNRGKIERISIFMKKPAVMNRTLNHAPAPKHLRSSTGTVQDKNQCTSVFGA